jgi:sugar phosphate isomerase/epimerase
MIRRSSTSLTLLISLFATAAVAEESTRPDAGELSKEYLQRWTPGGDTNAEDLPYPHVTAPYQKENDADWVDDRWQLTEKGPFLCHSFLVRDHAVGAKLTCVAAGPGKYLLYDLEAGSFVAGVTSGKLQTDPARFGLLKQPQLLGEVAFFVPAGKVWRRGKVDSSVAAGERDYQGLHVQGDRVLVVSRIAGVEVLESPLATDDGQTLTREVEVSAHDAHLWQTIAADVSELAVDDGAHSASWVDRRGMPRRVRLEAATSGIELTPDGSALLLHWPPAAKPSSVRISYGVASDQASKATFASIQSSEPPRLATLRRPGERRWGKPLAASCALAKDAGESPYVVDRINPPRDNRFHALFFLAGLDFFASGDAAVCTAHGDVWIVRGLDETLENVTWQRFATGLYQPLGLEIVDERVIVLGRDQLTRLHDENGDGEADYYESFNHDLVDYGAPHAYAMRLERTPEGSFVFVKAGEGPHGSALLRLSADGEQLEVIARGFRHPFGMGAGPRGEVTVADSEGNWVPSSKIDLVEPGGFYGFCGAATSQGDNPAPLRPLCFIPKVADNSCGGQFWHTSASWGPYHRGGMFHFSWGRCTLHAVLSQQVGDRWQAATVEIPDVVLQSGPAEAEFHPRDGQLYVVGLDGWQTAAQVDGSFERIRYTGKPVNLPSRFAAHADGLSIEFDEALDPGSLDAEGAIHVEQWNYRWSSTYGSYHYSPSDPDRVGHDGLAVQNARMSEGGKKLILQIAGLRPVDQIHVALNLRTLAGAALKCNVYGTINALAPPLEATAGARLGQLLAKDNLVAWCIVPFDGAKRGPEERAAMLKKLGLKRVAYDWRAEHIPTFDAELVAYARHGIELHAFWMPVDTDSPLREEHWPIVLDLVKRHNVSPELWVMLNNALVESLAEDERAPRAAKILEPVARAAAERNCRIGFYNHGGWWGEPENQIRVLEILKSLELENVGLVYSFHHAHSHVPDFAQLARRMQPYLLTVNINGMRDGGPQILQIGRGEHEASMLRELVAAGYRGPIGILHHRDGVDAETGLSENLLGIKRLLESP